MIRSSHIPGNQLPLLHILNSDDLSLHPLPNDMYMTSGFFAFEERFCSDDELPAE